ncbi:MAG: hypothetical protein PVF05_01725 [Gemmatimonadales bacterium]|jgi:hypothetical protein
MSLLLILLLTAVVIGLILGLLAKQSPGHLLMQIGAMCAATLVFYTLVMLLN